MNILQQLFGWAELAARLDRIDQRLATMETRIMATLQDVEESIQSETTIVDGITALITHLSEELKAALADVDLPPEVQARVDAAFALKNEENKQKLADALLANTDSA